MVKPWWVGWLLVVACSPSSGGAGAVDAGELPAPDADPSTPDADLDPPDAAPPAGDPLDLLITADNRYAFGVGGDTGIDPLTWVEGPVTTLAGQIFDCPVGQGPDAYTIPAARLPAADGWLYVVVFDDARFTRGWIAELERGGTTRYAGPPMQVCATAVEVDPAGVLPSAVAVNSQIALCNAGDDATLSDGWVDESGAVTAGAVGLLAAGELNDDAGGDFRLVCQDDPTSGLGMDPQARWLWYSPGGNGIDPFNTAAGETAKRYVIFRMPL
jgi:hypothetical protein